MLEISKPSSLTPKLPFLINGGMERIPPAPAVQLIARDAFVVEVGLKLEHMQRDITSLGREIELVKSDISELREETDRNYRFQSFQEKEQRLRNQRLEDMQRRVSEFAARLDSLGARRDGNYQSFPSLEAISRRVTDLCSIERDFRKVERKLKLSAALFCGSVLMWLLAAVAF